LDDLVCPIMGPAEFLHPFPQGIEIYLFKIDAFHEKDDIIAHWLIQARNPYPKFLLKNPSGCSKSSRPALPAGRCKAAGTEETAAY
jgi:hypothetical protein